MKMPYGEHKGADLEDLPYDYLLWVERDWKDDTLRKAAEDEVRRRIDHHEEYD